MHQAFGAVSANQLLVHTSLLAMLSHSDDPALQLLTAQHLVQRWRATPAGPPPAAWPKQREGRVHMGALSRAICACTPSAC